MIEEIRNLVHAVPFEPFEIHMADGRSFRVRHPDFIMTGHRFYVVVIPDERSPLEMLPSRMISGVTTTKEPESTSAG